MEKHSGDGGEFRERKMTVRFSSTEAKLRRDGGNFFFFFLLRKSHGTASVSSLVILSLKEQGKKGEQLSSKIEIPSLLCRACV